MALQREGVVGHAAVDLLVFARDDGYAMWGERVQLGARQLRGATPQAADATICARQA